MQDAPKGNNHKSIWDMVIEDELKSGSSFNEEYIVPDMKKRNRKGIETYGVPLQPFNGRDALLDAYEEALDLMAYLKQADTEKPNGKFYMLYSEARRLATAIRSEMYFRDGC